MEKIIYLDHAATTKLRKEALDAMLPYLTEYYGNAGSSYHLAVESRKAIRRARGEIASVLGAKETEIFFTSGGSESDNWAIKGAAKALTGKGRHIITSQIEHPAVLNSCRELECSGFEVTYLGTDETGRVSVPDLRRAIRSDTILISIMYANNETGILQPVQEIGKAAREHGILFHSDAVQAYGHIPLSVKENGIGLLSVSAHKFGGPKGIGFLYKNENVSIKNLIDGGGQEMGQRSGTENTAGIVGLAGASQSAYLQMKKENQRIAGIRNYLCRRLLEEIPGAVLNGMPENGMQNGEAYRLPGHINISFPGLEAERILIMLDSRGICASGGSACSTGSGKPSHVLAAMGLSAERIRGAVRLTLGVENTKAEMDEAVECMKEIVSVLGF